MIWNTEQTKGLLCSSKSSKLKLYTTAFSLLLINHNYDNELQINAVCTFKKEMSNAQVVLSIMTADFLTNITFP